VFSGIVEEVGTITEIVENADGRGLRIAAEHVLADAKVGDSISTSGCCLTVTKFESTWFYVEAVHETLRRTKLGNLKVGDRVNLERAMRLSDRLGGHLVSGHVDALAKVVAIKKEGFSNLVEFELTADLAPFFIEKGSVTVDGVSLTVANLKENSAADCTFIFAVALIPHTLEVTTMGALRVGDAVNIEADIIGKYVARMLSPHAGENINKGGLSLSFPAEQGYT
jgi:riboflavin synthase